MAIKPHHFITKQFIFQLLTVGFILAVAVIGVYFYSQSLLLTQKVHTLTTRASGLDTKMVQIKNKLASTSGELNKLKLEDQYVRNNRLEDELSNIKKTYSAAVKVYENLVKLREKTAKIPEFDKKFAQILTYLDDRNFASGSAHLTELQKDITAKEAEIAAAFAIPANVPVNNNAPGSGYQRQSVEAAGQQFMVDIIAADLNSTKVIVDTASDGTCTDNCPVTSLGDYAARSGAFAAINGPYFCPDSYPSCAGKKNSFDTLLMNKNKVYFNSDNNVYSTVPAVIFSGSSARFVGRSLEWGRDTGVDSVIAAQPMLLSGGNVTFGGDGEIKRGGKGSRSFIGNKGSTVYIGVVYNANVAEVAQVLKVLGLENALNLDSGGSTALWSNGRYLAGPGRNLPFGILFVRK